MDTTSPQRVGLMAGHRRVESSQTQQMLSPETSYSSRYPAQPGPMDAPPLLLRSKSELTMSSLPLMKMHSSSSEVSLAASTQTVPVKDEKPASLARSLLSRSSRLLQKRRSTNRMRSMEGLGESESWKNKDYQGSSNKRTSKHARLESRDMDSQFKPFISGPYNFQHLTHTGPSQAKALQSASHRDLVTEFSAIRAAQAPKRELKGIKAEDITPRFSPEASIASPVTTFESPSNSRSTSPDASPTASERRRSLRTSKSVDSFTRVSTKSFSSPKPPISPPPRRSSRQPQKPQALVFNPLTASLESPIIPDRTTPVSANSSPKSYFNIKNASFVPTEHGTVEEVPRLESEIIAQAVTTPDDSAYLFITHQRSPSSVGLADVPEEEEDAARHDSRDVKSKELRHARSFPSRSFVKPVDALQWSTPQLQSEEWRKVADPILPQQSQKEDIPSRRYSRRVSQVYAFGQSSWEEDIDYCYEHAMEAEGLGWDQDWTQDEPVEAGMSDPNPPLPPSYSNPYLRDLAVEGDNATSATSSSVSVPGIVTPLESSLYQAPRTSTSSANSILLPFSPSVLIPKEYTTRVTHEENYYQKINYAESEKTSDSSFYYAPSFNVGVDVHRDYSPRSSGSPISKWPSKESLSTGKTASYTTVSNGSIKHRHSSSVGSIPELIPSSTSKRPQTAMTMSSDCDPLPIQRSTSPPAEPDKIVTPSSPPKKALPAVPKPTQNSRTRANSECGKRLLGDLSLIGAPVQPFTRLRAGSVASPSLATSTSKPKGPNHRTSYSLFPATSITSPR